MRIIKEGNPDKVKKTTLVSVSCPICGFEAELDLGESITQCPCCKSPNLVFTTPLADFTPRKKSPGERFPYDYYRFSEKTGDTSLSNQEISQMIDRTIKEYYSSEGGYAFSSAGDTFVAVFQMDEDNVDSFFIMVSKDHYEYDVINGG